MDKKEKTIAIANNIIKQAELVARFFGEASNIEKIKTAIELRFAEAESDLILQTPIPKYPSGGLSSKGMSIVGESGKELFIKDGKLNIN